ncbi:hypothetical protein HanXRQr2_Chr04g0150911 [Helianthus annuus]|uniref:Uncharacterized protein n=1 Tax=Helianthus annuus TaxID=4232 RepID=A0A251V901_HELAN|nr:hypothetical protein HanXRQr2_Chr04g0150911 [Helianthus annuus]
MRKVVNLFERNGVEHLLFQICFYYLSSFGLNNISYSISMYSAYCYSIIIQVLLFHINQKEIMIFVL